MEASQDFSARRDAITSSLVNTTRLATRIAGEDVGFHRFSNPEIGTALDEQNGRLLSLASKLLRCSTDTASPSISEVDDIEVNWRSIVDVVDSLLEKVDTCLDEFTGLIKRMTPTDGTQSPTSKPRPRRLPFSLRNQDIPKPQLLFETKATNYEHDLFRPFLESKPHAVIPLDQSRTITANDHGAKQSQHPYQMEIDQYQYPSSVYTRADPIPYKSFESTGAIFVDTFEGVLSMLDQLRSASEIAIDLEHHDTHSYIGLVSLMQISTRDQDWIVDTLKPWRRKLEVLNEVFADPSIVKVLHGAHMDSIWLQRDLGLYLVGLFDTHHASRVLGYTGGSLAFLLKKFIDFDAQKQYQTADWRTRPLPAEMFDYARSDTHFLLYIYDNMRNELIERSNFDNPEEDRLQAVLERSKETALQRYEHPVYDELEGQGSTGWFQLLLRNSSRLSDRQLAVFKRVHQWRDSLARGLDESLNYIMPNHVLFSIAIAMPDTMTPLLGVLHPISSEVRERTQELLDAITASKNVYDQAVRAAANGKVNETTTGAVSQTPGTITEQTQQAPSEPLNYRSTTSHFWGALLSVTKISASGKAVLATDGYNYAMPMGAYLQEAMATPLPLEPAQALQITNMAGSEGALNGQDSHEPESSRKRKRGETEQAQDSTSPTTANAASQTASTQQPADAEEAMHRARRKLEKRAAKQKRKAEREGAAAGGEPVAEEETFDYENAPSVLNPEKVKGLKTGGPPQAFNPYAKAQDGPAGLKRAQNHRVGKSATFKQ